MRKTKAWHATRDAQAAWELRQGFEDLFAAAMAWRGDGDYVRLETALEALRDKPGYTGFPPLDNKMTRDHRIAALAERYVTVSQFVNRMRQVADETDAHRRTIGDELRLVTAETGGVAEYERELLRHLRAEKIGQTDLHPVSRDLGIAIAQAVRDFNKKRRGATSTILPNDYSDHPVGNWASLPTMFAGVELVELSAKDAKWPEPFPLPPSTDIATFTPDRIRLPFGKDRFETVKAWAAVIQQWAKQSNKSVSSMQCAVWALLLAHRIPEDRSDLTRLDGLEVQSPWRAGHIVRIDVLDEPEDDVPY